MTEVRVYTFALEDMLFGGLRARITGARLSEDRGKIYFEIEGLDVPTDAELLVVQRSLIQNVTFAFAPPTG